MLNKQALITSFFSQPAEFKVTPTKKLSPINKNEQRKFLTEYNKTVKRNIHQQDASHQWSGYLFVASSNFTEYTVINILPRHNYALKAEVSVDHKVATATVDDNSALVHINVEEPFRRQKIGRELIRFINKCCPQFVVFGGSDTNSRYRLTHEGAALIGHCLNKRILSTTQVVTSTVPPSPMKPTRK